MWRRRKIENLRAITSSSSLQHRSCSHGILCGSHGGMKNLTPITPASSLHQWLSPNVLLTKLQGGKGELRTLGPCRHLPASSSHGILCVVEIMEPITSASSLHQCGHICAQKFCDFVHMDDARQYKLYYLYMVMTLKGKIARLVIRVDSWKSHDNGFHRKNLLSLHQYELKELILKACRKITEIRWLTDKKNYVVYPKTYRMYSCITHIIPLF
jgi:hypothetical protein